MTISTHSSQSSATSSQQDFLASRIPIPGSDGARQMTERSGRYLLTLLDRYIHDTSFSKTFLESSAWGSAICYLNWRHSVIPCTSRLYFQLVPSTPRTDETGFGLWPTPTASDTRDRGGPSTPCVRKRAELGKQLNLSHYVDGPLNPAWVEWLMGYPEGWTDLGD